MTTVELLDKKMLEDGKISREITLDEVRTLVISKKGKPSRYTYWLECQKCKAPKKSFKYELFATNYRYGGRNHNCAILSATCPFCGNNINWEASGYFADPNWKPESSFNRERDSQRQMAYNWENQFFAGDDLDKPISREEAEDLFHKIALSFTMPVVELQFKDPGNFSRAWGFHKVVLTGACGRKPWVVVHELAHIIEQWMVAKNLTEREAGHGPVWVAVYMILLEHFLGVHRHRMTRAAEKAGVKFADDELIRKAMIEVWKS